MEFQELIRKYLDALQDGDTEQLLTIFDENAAVSSPLYGQLPAKQFYKDLFQDTSQSKITLLNTFQSNEKEDTCAGHFRYDWTMKDDTLVTFECVDVFKVSKEHKIRHLTIIYDTYGIRQNFEKLKKE